MIKSYLWIGMVFVGGSLLFTASGADQYVDFNKDIQPILLQSCVECHGPDKQKGKLRLDLKSDALKDASVIVPGKAAESELYQRIILPPDHDDIMPAKGDPLTKNQTDLIRDWINQGAPWPEDQTLEMPTEAASQKADPPLPEPTAAEARAISQLQLLGVHVRPVAVNIPWTSASFRSVDSNNLSQAMPLLSKILTLQDLNFAGMPILDGQLKHISGLTNLVRLHLENTPVSDAGLAHLKNLDHLRYLNLYGTKITDAGLDELRNLKQLKNLFLWRTQVSDAGADKLRGSLAHTDINLGWKMGLPRAPEEEPGTAEKPDESNAEKNN